MRIPEPHHPPTGGPASHRQAIANCGARVSLLTLSYRSHRSAERRHIASRPSRAEEKNNHCPSRENSGSSSMAGVSMTGSVRSLICFTTTAVSAPKSRTESEMQPVWRPTGPTIDARTLCHPARNPRFEVKHPDPALMGESEALPVRRGSRINRPGRNDRQMLLLKISVVSVPLDHRIVIAPLRAGRSGHCRERNPECRDTKPVLH